MTIVGWHASHEQIASSELLHMVQRAETAGFGAAMSSDHFSPWSRRQADTDRLALEIAHDQWRTNVFSPPVCWDLELAEHFDEVARFVRPEDMHGSVLVSSDTSRLRDRLTELIELGFDGVWIHHVGHEQEGFIDAFGEHVVPSLRAIQRTRVDD
jgi:alkanesulfonate monooxygenase SsuD/methylene tetrahydromethanopterin reductase-like flavin-dependent oxidoreductase (luciferase family)